MKLLVLSSSSLHTFLECRKAYGLTYALGIEPLHDNQAIIKGQSFHSHGATFADCYNKNDAERWKEYSAKCIAENDEMFPVFKAYRLHKWQAKPEQILFSQAEGDPRWEHPIYLPLVKSGGYDIWIRFTIDMVWRNDAGWLEPIDYKTFSVAPSEANSDLDFQAKGIIEMVRRRFGEDRVQFTFKHVRSVAPGSPRGTGPWELHLPDGVARQKALDLLAKDPDAAQNQGIHWFKIKDLKGGPKREIAEVWKVDECYFDTTVVCSPTQGAETWKEMQDAAKDLVRAMREGRWYRSARRGTMPYTCHTCLSKRLCGAESELGKLDEQTIEQLAKPRAPLTVPDDEWLRFRKRLPKKIGVEVA